MDAPLRILFTTLPDEAAALDLARRCVEARLAACVQVLAPCRSVYRWQEAVEEATEWPLMIKTTGSCWNALMAALSDWHPYEVPELVEIGVGAVLPAYLQWAGEQTRPDARA